MLSTGLHLDVKDKRTEEMYGQTYRYLAQTLGTEWGRELIHPDLWIMCLKYRLQKTYSPIIIDDVRFENEAKFIREHGQLFYIHNNNVPEETIINKDEQQHISEAGFFSRYERHRNTKLH